MLSATAITALQNILIRLLADSGIHPFEIAFFRCFFGFVSVAVLVFWSTRALPRSIAIVPLASSGVLHLLSMLAFFYGLSVIPLNDASALPFATPLFGTIAAALFLGLSIHTRYSRILEYRIYI